MTYPEKPTRGSLSIDMEKLKGLSHPLRVQLLEALSTYGAATASQLGERLGESSGATSYHLRQLEKHGFVHELPDRGNGRERWWERTPDGISLNITDFPPDSAERAAAATLEREWDRSRAAVLDEFNRRGPSELAKEWYDASAINTINLRLTQDELRQLVIEFETIAERYARNFKQERPGTRPVQVHFNAFPVMGSEPLPEGPENDSGSA